METTGGAAQEQETAQATRQPAAREGTSGQGQGSALPLRAGIDGGALEIAGATGSALAEMLAAWQREQDRLANRAWRRPGGMARPAGL